MGRNSVSRHFVPRDGTYVPTVRTATGPSAGAAVITGEPNGRNLPLDKAVKTKPDHDPTKAERLARLLERYPWNEAIRRLKSNAPSGAFENEVR